jgi:hypothetical protein
MPRGVGVDPFKIGKPRQAQHLIKPSQRLIRQGQRKGFAGVIQQAKNDLLSGKSGKSFRPKLRPCAGQKGGAPTYAPPP